MTWFKVDDNLAFHRKVVAAGNAAMGLWVRAGSWCAQHLTDGFIPDHMTAILGTPAQKQKLITMGLWIEVEGGCQFHEWNENGRQPTAKSIQDKRSAAADRQARYRAGTYKKPQVSEASSGVSSASVTPIVTPSVTAPPTRPDPSSKKEHPQASPAPEAERFTEFYEAYPRRQDRRAAEKAWKAALRRGAAPEKIIASARSYARLQIGNERRFIKLPATWLNAASYDDELEQPSLALVPAALDSFEEYRAAAAGQEASRLLGIAFNPRPQPPSDKTRYAEWARMTAVEWIDAHEQEIRAALTERKTG